MTARLSILWTFLVLGLTRGVSAAVLVAQVLAILDLQPLSQDEAYLRKYIDPLVPIRDKYQVFHTHPRSCLPLAFPLQLCFEDEAELRVRVLRMKQS